MHRQGPTVAAALLAFLALSGARAEAQPCTTFDYAGRCAPEQHARRLALYGLPTIETHQEAGDQVRRAFYVDGYDIDVLAISYVRAPGQDPTVSLYLPQPDGRSIAPITTSVPEGAWSDVLRRSLYFDRGLVPLPGTDPSKVICLHPWTWTVESTDPATSTGAAAVRRRTQTACDDGMAPMYAQELSIAAVSLFSYCHGLNLRFYRTEASLLADCFRLRGDRNVAAMVRNRVAEFESASHRGPAVLEDFFAVDMTIDLADQQVGPDNPARTWIDRVWGDIVNGTYLSVESVTGESSQRARVAGKLSRRWPRDSPDPDSGFRGEEARVEMTWGRKWDQFFVERITIGRFEEEKP